jgi:L-asparagine transporter-like permease
MGAPIALFVVVPIVVLLLVGLVLVVRGVFFGAKKTAEGVEEHVEAGEKRKRGFFG